MHRTEEKASSNFTKLPQVDGCDPFLVEDGRFVNVADGYVVPRNFAEFYERYPSYVKEFVRNRMKGRPAADIEDRESELLLFLMSLPEGSKFREPGYNGYPNGCTDRIQVFSATLSHGCSFPRFRSWLNLCLTHRMSSLDEKLYGNPVCRPNVHIIANGTPLYRQVELNEDWVMHRHFKLTGYPDEPGAMDQAIFQRQFENFINGFSDELAQFYTVLRESKTFTAVRKKLKMTEQQVYLLRSRLAAVAQAFVDGEPKYLTQAA